MELNKIINLDCLEYLKSINNDTVNLCILDPPTLSNSKWNNNEDYYNWFDKIISEIYRVSKYSCTIWIFTCLYDSVFIIPILEKHGFTFKQHITINKGLKSIAGRTNTKLKMFPTTTEHLFFFHKESRNYLRDYLHNKKIQNEKSSKEINLFLGTATNGGGKWSSLAGKKKKKLLYPSLEDWNKLQDEKMFGKFNIEYYDYVYKFNILEGITDVWDIDYYDKSYEKKHPTQKPYKLLERIIKCASIEGDIVLDPFMGSGMSALVSKKLNRNFLGCELDEKYFKNLLINII